MDDLQSVLETDVDLSAAYHNPVDLAEWYGDDRIRDLANAWGQADRLRLWMSRDDYEKGAGFESQVTWAG